MAQYEAQYWEPLLNCCTYSTVYCSAEKNLREYLQKFFTDPVKGWPFTFLTALFENLTGPDIQLRITFRCGRDRDHLRVTSTWQFIPMIRPITFLCRSIWFKVCCFTLSGCPTFEGGFVLGWCPLSSPLLTNFPLTFENSCYFCPMIQWSLIPDGHT